MLLWLVLTLGVAGIWARFGEGTVTTIVGLLSALIAMFPLSAVWKQRWFSTGRPSTPRQVLQASRELRRAILALWEEEAARRRFRHSHDQISVRWTRDTSSAGRVGEGLSLDGALDSLRGTRRARPASSWLGIPAPERAASVSC
ncbi:hypothetical protein RB614_24270 [Phytohabitans sp. ZYX-F-186]|uniref:Uncharacterized protein n=1 Tax=Phytohabitans maris TaxID=3071409 RepID=A0ABU0ZNY8_9ACTN|nr:hypothetical protein [Phytohabitans sp. ZYX-F-186]MDQ7907642.1 hypothetical protein [Phytohabitans sp. ZYX-F-186]